MSNGSNPPIAIALSNPNSGKNKKDGLEKFVQAVNNHSSIRHVISSSEGEMKSALNSAKQSNIAIIIVNGGDGTLQSVLTYLKLKENLAYQPELVLLKAGTTSMGFGDVGFKREINKVLESINRYAAGENQYVKKKTRQVLRMTLTQEELSLCGMFFGAGAIHSGILYCRQNMHTKGIRGELGPTMAMLRFLFDWITVNKLTSSTQAKVSIDQDNLFLGDFSIITATSLKRLLAGVYPYWRDTQDDMFALSLIKQGAPKPIKSGLRILRGSSPNLEEHEDYYRSYSASEVMLEIQDGFTLDGELFGEQGKYSEVILSAAGPVTFLTA